MGFDVVYLPPIHPIGKVNRKGRNNTLMPGPQDVGSPWAIGSDEGGHDAIHPQLGTFEDFDDFVARTRELGMEVALDLALQAAPDHPWVTEHPEWFTTRPDGSIAYAENPPKKYQDIYPLNFDNDPKGLLRRGAADRAAVGRARGEDLPGRQPAHQAAELLALADLGGQEDRPGRDLPGRGLHQAGDDAHARAGRLHPVLHVLHLAHRQVGARAVRPGAGRGAADYMRPNFFVNTPDILHASLQYGGPAMFRIRAVLASMLSPSWGVYSGYELFEHRAGPGGREEYLDSEKYQLRPRDFDGAIREGRSLAPYLAHLNQLRHDHPALQQLRNLRFHHVDNDALMAFSKRDDETGDTVLVVVTLDPYTAQAGTTSLDMPALGLDWHDRFVAHDEMGGGMHDYEWGQFNFVRLDPHVEPAHVFVVRR